MAARDDLARMLFVNDSPSAKDDAEYDWDYLQKHPKYLKGHYRLADAIVDAGYSKPRTITTRDELEAATPGTVAREDKHGIIWEKLSDGEGGTYWVETGDQEDYKYTAVELPVTVLWEPNA